MEVKVFENEYGNIVVAGKAENIKAAFDANGPRFRAG